MLTISSNQLSEFRRKSEQDIGNRLRPTIAELIAYRRLACEDRDWTQWWDSVIASASSAVAITRKTIAAHALFSLWFGHQYFVDQRVPWLRELLANSQGVLDYSNLEVDLNEIIEIATLMMEAVAGPSGELHLKAMKNLAQLCLRLRQGNLSPWNSALAEQVMWRLYPERFEDLSPKTRQWLINSVDQLSPSFAHGEKIQLPLLLSLFFFGADPWHDPALPELYRWSSDVLAMRPETMAECLHRQAAYSTGINFQTEHLNHD